MNRKKTPRKKTNNKNKCVLLTMEVVEVKIRWNLKTPKYYNVMLFFFIYCGQCSKLRKTITRNQFGVSEYLFTFLLTQKYVFKHFTTNLTIVLQLQQKKGKFERLKFERHFIAKELIREKKKG